jgi:hypothetical protein
MLPDNLFDIRPLILRGSKEAWKRVSEEEEAAFQHESVSKRAKVLDLRNTLDMLKVRS